MPSRFTILVTKGEVRSAKLQRTLDENISDLLDAEITIALHDGTLCVGDLLVGALPSAAVVVVDGKLAIVLHTELNGPIFAEDAHTDHEPVAVFKSAVAHFEGSKKKN
jgi:hypothetical protein